VLALLGKLPSIKVGPNGGSLEENSGISGGSRFRKSRGRDVAGALNALTRASGSGRPPPEVALEEIEELDPTEGKGQGREILQSRDIPGEEMRRNEDDREARDHPPDSREEILRPKIGQIDIDDGDMRRE
jgi:hypothetical protein